MKIKVNDFFENIGTVFRNPKDILQENEYEGNKYEYVLLPQGTYLIMNQDNDGFDLYDIQKNKNVFFEDGLVDADMEFEVFYTNPKEVLDLMIESLNKKIIQLSAEGWTVDPENKFFNLSPYIDRLNTLVTLKAVINVGNKKS